MSERGQKRRRLREQRRLREALLLDLGALVYELHRQGRRAPELLQQKAAELTVVDEEVRELQAELDGVPLAPAEETAEVDAVHEDEEALQEDELEEDERGEGMAGEDERGEDEPGEDEPGDDDPGEGQPGEGEPGAPEPDDEEPAPVLADNEEPRS